MEYSAGLPVTFPPNAGIVTFVPAAKIGIEGLEPNLSTISDPFIIHDIITAINGSL
jgi:hypothetical protein